MEYGTLISQAAEMMREEPWYASAMSNLSALLMTSLPDLNWAGFYLMRDGRLTVGPFQGKPACIHITLGKGVCGTAAQTDSVQRVPDVHEFPGHIACDSASNSEIVLPVHRREDGTVAAVLDLDSTLFARFCEEDERGLLLAVRAIEEEIDWDR